MQKVCQIFFYEGYVSLSPTVFNLSRILAKSGYHVTLLATQNSNDVTNPKEIASGVDVLYFSKKNLYKFLDINPVFYNLKALVKIIEIIIFSWQSLVYTLLSKKGVRVKSSINFGIDEYGLITALLFFCIFKQKFILLSLEIPERPRTQLKFISDFLRRSAALAYRHSAGVIIQDEDRFKTLCEYYQYQHSKVLYLPNSSLNDLLSDTKTDNFFREKFGISEEKYPHIVLSAGMIDEMVCSRTLAHAFASINNGCALVFHRAFSQAIKEEELYIQSLQQLNTKNLFLSLQAVPYEQVDKIYASSTIGLAFYDGHNDNYSKIAKASGKLAFYLKHGKPVLASNLPSLAELIEKYQFGILINDPSDFKEIELAIDKILNSYSEYSDNARACFAAEFDFEKKMELILGLIEDLQAAQLLNKS